MVGKRNATSFVAKKCSSFSSISNSGLKLLVCALIMISILVSAQSRASSIPRIGYLAWAKCETPNPAGKFFTDGLRDLGYKPGETIIFECRSANEVDSKLLSAATELIELGVDVIVSSSQPAARAAHMATKKIPIVSIISGDPVASGMAQSLARPGGNLTGLSYYATELTGKRLELLMEAMPNLKTVDVLSNPAVAYLPFEIDTRQAAKRLGVDVRIHQVGDRDEISAAFTDMKANNAEAVFVLPDLMLARAAGHIANLAIEKGLPVMSWGYWYADAGCLISYSTWYPDLSYRMAFYVDRILKGTAPGDLPIEQPTKFVLSINLKTAKALNIKLPQTLLFRADRFIE